MKSDWSGIMGSLMPMFNINNDNITDLIAHNEQNDTYPAVRVARASADYDGNNIPDTYLKKSDAKNNVSALSNTATNYNDQTPVVQYFKHGVFFFNTAFFFRFIIQQIRSHFEIFKNGHFREYASPLGNHGNP